MRKRVALPNGAWWEQGANRRRGYGTVYSRSGRVIATSMKLDELNALDAESRGSWVSSVEISRLYSMKSALNLVRTQINKQKLDNAKG